MTEPDACTLPTAERPLRLAEFDELFAVVLRADRPAPTRVRLGLPATPAIAARSADLVVRETRCCSFFRFTLTATDGALSLDVEVPAEQTGVLDALAARMVHQ